MPGYDNYRFRDKDPVIDVLRTAIQFVAVAEGIKFNKVLNRIANDIGCTPGMLRGWFFGSTQMPRHAGVAAVVRWLGGEIRYAGLRRARR